jgi:hypothetical protein
MLKNLLVVWFGGFFYKFSTDCLQWTQFVMHHVPYDRQVDAEILTDEDIA